MNGKESKKMFIAVSKLVGIIIGILSTITILYSMFIMAKLKDISSLSTLIGGVLGVAATYVGFYISMAKAEHIEDKRNQVKKELHKIEKGGITKEEKVEEKELQKELTGYDKELNNVSNS